MDRKRAQAHALPNLVERKKMKSFLKLIAVAAAVRALTLTLLAIPTAALASEYCLTNTSGMRGCGFATLQQCLNSLSGLAGTCARDPFYQDPNSALAYAPKRSHSHSKKPAER
jgi:hypothetical protein